MSAPRSRGQVGSDGPRASHPNQEELTVAVLLLGALWAAWHFRVELVALGGVWLTAVDASVRHTLEPHLRPLGGLVAGLRSGTALAAAILGAALVGRFRGRRSSGPL